LVAVLAGGAALALAGGITLFVSYNEATKIDRSSSTVVVRQFVDAEFSDKGDIYVSLYICQRGARIEPMNDLRASLSGQDRARGTKTEVVISSIESFDSGQRVDVDLEINRARGVEVRTQVEHWRFTLEHEDGWRVYSAEQLPDPSPSSTATPPTAG